MAWGFWTPERDKELMRRLAKGERALSIAVHFGTTKNAVIARSHRVRGHQFPYDVARSQREHAEAKVRMQQRAEKRQQLARELKKKYARLDDRRQLIKSARADGHTLQSIANLLGLTRQRIQQIETTIKNRAGAA